MANNRFPRLSDFIYEMDLATWSSDMSVADLKRAIESIEAGKVLYAPFLSFKIKDSEVNLLSETYLLKGVKNISYDPHSGKVKGVHGTSEAQERLQNLLERFSREAYNLVSTVLPFYKNKLIWGRTSFRPVEIKGRETSYRKDGTRLHVDAFPASPSKGKRILRVFSNINLEGTPSEWRIGEPFSDVAKRYLPKVKPQFPGINFLLRAIGYTKEKRTLYDHIMLSIHDKMKGDKGYQDHVSQIRMPFPAKTTWIVMTDCTSHAAMAGQHVLDQTFYLNPQDMMNPKLSPLYILERITGKALV